MKTLRSVFRATFLLLLCVIVATCATAPNEGRRPPVGGISQTNLDSTVSPGTDFFKYVNGKWLSMTRIPSERGAWSAFIELREHNQRIIRNILEEPSALTDHLEGTDERKAIDFYSIAMDSSWAETSGLNPLKPFLVRIDGLANKVDLQNYLIEKETMNGDGFFRLEVSPDELNSKRMMVHFGSGGIGLPERDYYFKNDPKSGEIRLKYKDHVTRMLVLSGWDEIKSQKAAERIFLLESELAAATMTKEDRRDPRKQYNKLSVNDLSSLAPSINWKAYFSGLKIQEDSIIVKEPAFLKSYERIGYLFTMEDIRSYLRWSILRKAAPYLNHALVMESFEFNGKFLLGSATMRPRWMRVIESLDEFLGEAIGKLYVTGFFTPESKLKAVGMVENVRFAFADRIKQLGWMSDSTKKMALRKLQAITVKVGFPDKWRNYPGLVVVQGNNNGSYFGNVVNAQNFQFNEKINRLGKPTDRMLWGMLPQAVNASYNPHNNEIVIPAGILQAPFYDFRADDAVNFGGIGAVIGHELSHCFDDIGSKYDEAGNLKNWWTELDLKNFRMKGQSLVEQFNRYQPLPGLFVQGQFCLGENIGDLGGLNVAFDGLNRSYRENNNRPGLIDGLHPEQRFFISWATIWRTKYRDESLRNQILTNVHAPAMYRANGPVSNMPDFYKAFGVKPGNEMYREEKDRVDLW